MTDQELRDQAVAHLELTTISYPDWLARVKAGRYTPKDGSATQWGLALEALAQIGTPAPPPPPLPPASPPLVVADFSSGTAPPFAVQALPTPPAANTTFGRFAIVDDPIGGSRKVGKIDLLGDTSHTNERVELNLPRTIANGVDDYYTMEYLIKPGYGGSPIINQLCFTTGIGTGGPAFAFRLSNNSVDLLLQTGVNSSSLPAYEFNSNTGVGFPGGKTPNYQACPPSLFATDTWLQFLIHNHWSNRSPKNPSNKGTPDGVVEIWCRHRGDTDWIKTVDMQAGIAATLQCSTTGTMPSGGLDKMDCYRHSNSTPMTIYVAGYSRSDNWASADYYASHH